jgi:hypothetical protein
MPEEPLPDRLERLKDKQERGEELTDEEIEQLQTDIRELHDGLASLVETFAEHYGPVIRDMGDDLQSFASMVGEMEQLRGDDA